LNIQLPDVGEDIHPGKCGAVRKPPGLGGRVKIFLKSGFLFKKILPGS
jgi:hypothetical protein